MKRKHNARGLVAKKNARISTEDERLLNQSISLLAEAQELLMADELSTSLEKFNSAIALLESIKKSANGDAVAHELLMAYFSKGNIINELGNPNAAIEFYDKAIQLSNDGFPDDPKNKLLSFTATIYLHKATADQVCGRLPSALKNFDLAIGRLEYLDRNGGDVELMSTLANAYRGKAFACNAIHDFKLEAELFDLSAGIWSGLIFSTEEPRHDFGMEFTSDILNKARALHKLGNFPDAISHCDSAIQSYEAQREISNEPKIDIEQSHAFRLKGRLYLDLNEYKESEVQFGKAIALWERLIDNEQDSIYFEDLALDLESRAFALSANDELPQAVIFYDRAIQIFERIVDRDGIDRLGYLLASAYRNEADLLLRQGEIDGTLKLFNSAIKIFEELIKAEQTHELNVDLAWSKVGRAVCLANQGHMEQAETDARISIELLKSEVGRSHRKDLGDFIRNAELTLKGLI